VNGLDPGPCYSGKDVRVREEGGCPKPDLPPPPPNTPWGILCRDSAGMEKAREWAAPTRPGRSGTGSSYQQSEDIV
jgi:hypothetical protein